MKEIIERIQTMSERELQVVMRAIQNRYASAFPEWDVVYMALHKDPELRVQEIEGILGLVSQELRWILESREQTTAPTSLPPESL